MHKYRLVAKKGEGTFSEVLKAQCIKNGKYVAIKCMKNHFDSLDQVNNLREIQALRRLSPHPNIIKLLEVLYDQPTGRLALVFELMDMNIYELIRGRRHYVAEERVKNYMYQLMKAMDHMHRNGIFHRDIKPENILIMDDCLKLADFGSCRGIYSKQPYTEYISTRWYRAPECLLTDGYYNYKMDMWGVGCVFFEIVSLFPLFPGTNELDQIQKIHNILGTPPAELLAKMKKRSQHMDFNFPAKEGTGIAKLIPHVSPDCCDLVTKLLAYNPDDRLSARQALRHPYFRELREAEKRQKALLTPDLSNHFSAMESEKRHQVSSPAGSDAANNDVGAISPPETSRHSENGQMGLPSIAKQATGSHTGGAHHLGGTCNAGNSTAAMGNSSLGGAAPAPGGQDVHGLHGHEKDDVHSLDASHRLPGLHAQGSLENLLQEDGSLPPIGNLSLGKANMSMNQTGRRGALPAHYDANGYNKNKVAQAGAAAGAVTITKRQTGMAGVPMASQIKYNKPQAGHKEAASFTSNKYKANNATKGSSKYISPYSLRQLAEKGGAA